MSITPISMEWGECPEIHQSEDALISELTGSRRGPVTIIGVDSKALREQVKKHKRGELLVGRCDCGTYVSRRHKKWTKGLLADAEDKGCRACLATMHPPSKPVKISATLTVEYDTGNQACALWVQHGGDKYGPFTGEPMFRRALAAALILDCKSTGSSRVSHDIVHQARLALSEFGLESSRCDSHYSMITLESGRDHGWVDEMQTVTNEPH